MGWQGTRHAHANNELQQAAQTAYPFFVEGKTGMADSE